MESYAHCIALKYVLTSKFSVEEESMKLGVWDQVHAEIKRNTNGEKDTLILTLHGYALDSAQPNVKAMKFCAHQR